MSSHYHAEVEAEAEAQTETETIYLALLLWRAIVKLKPPIRICENQSVELPDKQSK